MFTNGDVIYAYTRKDALADGSLVDEPIETLRKEHGVKYHTAMTLALFETINPSEKDESNHGQSITGRIHDLLTIFVHSCRRHEGGPEMIFQFIIAGDDGEKRITVKSIIGPGDTPEPVITFMMEDED